MTPNFGISINPLSEITPSIGALFLVYFKKSLNKNGMAVGFNLETKIPFRNNILNGMTNYSVAIFGTKENQRPASGFLLGFQQVSLKPYPGITKFNYYNPYMGLVFEVMPHMNVQLDLAPNWKHDYNSIGMTINFKF